MQPYEPALPVLIRGSGSLRRNGIWLVLVTGALFALPAVATLQLKHAGEDAAQAQTNLSGYVYETQVQDGLEWRVISNRVSPNDVREKLAASRGHAAAHLASATSLGLPSAAAAQLTAMSSRYSTAVDDEVRLLSSGETEAAAELDETAVDPAFEQIAGFLEGQALVLTDKADAVQRLGDAGVLLTVLLPLILVSVVQGRRRRDSVRELAEHALDLRYRTLIDQSSDLVLVVDRAGRPSFASPSAERLLAPEGGAIDLLAAVDPADRDRLGTALLQAAAGGMTTGEFRLNGADGPGTYELTVQDLTDDPSVNGLVLNGRDVTSRLVMARELTHRAMHDELTELPNRTRLFDSVEQALLNAEHFGTRVGLLLLDLERFKEVNDTLGHHYGDELLRQIGPRLATVAGGVDAIARVGGDEFAVLLPEVAGVEEATEVAKRLLGALALPFHVEGVDLDVEASVGVVISGRDGRDAITLMQHADVAMYVAKTQHLGVAAYDPTADQHSAAKLALAGDLRRGLQLGELVMYYQPKVSVSTGDLVGAEALVRWQHPEKGLVLPDDFIPVAEGTGLITPLTQFVLEAAIAQARTWMDAGRPVPIAVNLSARNLHDNHLADTIAGLLGTYAVPAHLLELEVTESAIMIDPERARQILEKLSDLGVRLSLDDFGAGYTSLSQLKALPISELKIDRSFVMAMMQDRHDKLIVQSVISLGHNLGLTLVAEGVDTEQALTALAGLGCDLAQGYHIARPLAIADFDSWSAPRKVSAPLA